MKLGTNFDTGFYKERKQYFFSQYDGDFIIIYFHFLKFFNKIIHLIIGIGIVVGFLALMYVYITQHVWIIYIMILILIPLIIKIIIEFLKYYSSFIVITKDEVIIYEQSSLLERHTMTLNMNHIIGLDISTPNRLGTFLNFGTLTLKLDLSEPVSIYYFPRIQYYQKKLRQHLIPKEEEQAIPKEEEQVISKQEEDPII